PLLSNLFSFSFTAPPPTTLHSLSLHDALPISTRCRDRASNTSLAHGNIATQARPPFFSNCRLTGASTQTATSVDAPVRRQLEKKDRKSTRLNSSHRTISYAVFCLKKKNKKKTK